MARLPPSAEFHDPPRPFEAFVEIRDQRHANVSVPWIHPVRLARQVRPRQHRDVRGTEQLFRKPLIVAGGRVKNVLTRLLKGEELGTIFLPRKK